MKSAQTDSRDFDAGFSQRAVGHLSVTTLALTTSPGNFGRHRRGRQPADKFASLDIVRHHFLPSFVIQYFSIWDIFLSGKDRAPPLRCSWTNFAALKVEELWRPAHQVFTSHALRLDELSFRCSEPWRESPISQFV